MRCAGLSRVEVAALFVLFGIVAWVAIPKIYPYLSRDLALATLTRELSKNNAINAASCAHADASTCIPVASCADAVRMLVANLPLGVTVVVDPADVGTGGYYTFRRCFLKDTFFGGVSAFFVTLTPRSTP